MAKDRVFLAREIDEWMWRCLVVPAWQCALSGIDVAGPGSTGIAHFRAGWGF